LSVTLFIKSHLLEKHGRQGDQFRAFFSVYLLNTTVGNQLTLLLELPSINAESPALL
jgi:hypothetical protein